MQIYEIIITNYNLYFDSIVLIRLFLYIYILKMTPLCFLLVGSAAKKHLQVIGLMEVKHWLYAQETTQVAMQKRESCMRFNEKIVHSSGKTEGFIDWHLYLMHFFVYFCANSKI